MLNKFKKSNDTRYKLIGRKKNPLRLLIMMPGYVTKDAGLIQGIRSL